MRILDIDHRLAVEGDLTVVPPKLGASALRASRLIGYEGPLAQGDHRETRAGHFRRRNLERRPGLLQIMLAAEEGLPDLQADADLGPGPWLLRTGRRRPSVQERRKSRR